MKIGILTYHNTTNYGALYQCYALQKYINLQNKDCEIVDYNNEKLLKEYNINPFKSKNIREFIKKIIAYKYEIKNKNSFAKFIKNNIKISEKIYTEKNIKEADSIYDMFISGSDQVWNFELSGYDKNYFMIFCEQQKKRNSYSASIGKSTLTTFEQREIKKLLKLQNNIAIREMQGKIELEKLTNKKIVNTIDPVFLLNKEDWESLILNNKKSINSKYIFVYEVARTQKLREFARFLSKKTGCKIYFCSKAGKKMKNTTLINDATPSEFLGYIKNANYIVTSSFHGLALSLIFNKEVFFDVHNTKDLKFSSRLENLSRLAGIENSKIIEPFDKMNLENIKYDEIVKKINTEVEKSKVYLDKIIKK